MQSEIFGGAVAPPDYVPDVRNCACTSKLGKIRVFLNKGHFLIKENCIFALMR